MGAWLMAAKKKAKISAADAAKIKALENAAAGLQSSVTSLKNIGKPTPSPLADKSMATPDENVAEYTGTAITPGPGPFNVDTAQDKSGVIKLDQDALARLRRTMESLGIGTLGSTIEKLLSLGNSEDTVLNRIKYDDSLIDPNGPKDGPRWNDAYKLRFAGNEGRKKMGLNVIDEGTYLAMENSYADTLKRYGLGNMISTDAAANQKQFATWIGNDLSTTEFSERIKLVSNEVINMDPAIKANFMAWYPSLTHTDLVSYFLAPEETLPMLQNKVAAADIGAAANQQGLSTDRATAEMYAAQGVTYGQAQKAYSDLAEVLPTSQKLSNIYAESGINYNQKMGEQEYLGLNAAAKLKRNRLASQERAMFSGDAGLNPNINALGRSTQGRF